MFNHNLVLFIALFISQTCFASQNEVQNASTKQLRSYTTCRILTKSPKIDGILDDDCWRTGAWVNDFTQWIPNEGAKPSQPTEIKVLYDDQNIYVAIRAFDAESDKIQIKGGRRDEFEGDCVGVCFDSYHDHRTGFEFDVTAAGQKLDAIVTNPLNSDMNWNPVWFVKVSKDHKGWYAEMEIPLSQLRYSAEDIQVWGFHCWRWISRLQEESDWEPQSSTGPGVLYLFGELHGIKGLRKSRRMELMPYTVGEVKTFRKEHGNPYADKGVLLNGAVGLDAKIGLSSNFTLDLTVNPDFGQVEADPSVMNITAFETFFDEKRPFFLEGKNIFNFDLDDANLFYSRRIGQSTGFIPGLQAGEYLKMPENTTIYSAEKLSGKTSNGLTVGVIQSLTANEKAYVSSPSSERRVEVEPLTSYTVGRLQQDFKNGNTVIGGIFTATNRFTTDSNFDNLNHQAYTGGLDLLHQWHEKEFFIDCKLLGSSVQGKPQAITLLEKSSAHYFQRPDADYLSLDSTSSHLDGFGGKLKIGKGSKGLWKYSTEINWRSPGLELNDIGFMQVADYIKQSNSISYFINKPHSIFRTYSFSFNENNLWNFGKEYLGSNNYLNFSCDFLNQWGINSSLNYCSKTLDTHILRGGPAMYIPSNWSASLGFHSDYSKMMGVSLNSTYLKAYNDNNNNLNISSDLSIRPFNTLKFYMGINFSNYSDNLQYVTVKYFENKRSDILAKIDQKTVGLTLRVDYNISPELSIQYYGSPFTTVGSYSHFKMASNSRSDNYSNRFMEFSNPILEGNVYQLDQNQDTRTDYTITNPNFTFSQFRSNLVAKWEYKSGSSIYFVWSNEQTEYENISLRSMLNAYKTLKKSFPNNLFLIKLNYWFSL